MVNYKRWLFTAGFCLLFSSMIACSANESFQESANNRAPSSQKNGVNLDKTYPTKNQKQSNAIKNAEKQGRKITYKADIDIDVKNYQQSRTTLESLVSKSQGYLVDSREHQNSKESHTGTFTYRIPQAHFQTFIDSLKKISSESPNITIKGDDVTEEMVDLNSRLKAKKATETRLLALMSKATESSALLRISRQLDDIQVEIEEIKGRLHYLNHRVDFSEVTVSLTHDVGVPAPDNASMVQKMKETFIESATGMVNIGKNLLIFLAGAIPVLIVLSVILVPLYLFIHHRRRAKKQQNKESE